MALLPSSGLLRWVLLIELVSINRTVYILYFIHNKDDAQSPTNKRFTRAVELNNCINAIQH
jgi:hypothetical protein